MLHPTASAAYTTPRSGPPSTAPHPASGASFQPDLTQTIAHSIDGDPFVFEVPVTHQQDGRSIVLLEHVLDLFPTTVGLCLKDGTQVPFMTTEDGVLMVPMRVRYHPTEILNIMTATPPPPPLPARRQPQSLPSNNPFKALQSSSNTPPAQVSLDLLDLDPFGLGPGSSITAATHSSSAMTTTSPPHLPPRLPPRTPPRPQTKPVSLATEGLAELIAQPIPIANLPVPRLFIALPDAKPRDFDDLQLARLLAASTLSSSSASSTTDEAAISSLLNADKDTMETAAIYAAASRTFRLYFLCDCGQNATFPNPSISYTRTSNGGDIYENDGSAVSTDLSNCIHIADQAGYEILNLQHFARDLGAYTLRFLYGLRDGVHKSFTSSSPSSSSPSSPSRPNVYIPPLDNVQYTDVLQPFTWDLKERVSTAIQVLEHLHTPGPAPVETVDLSRLWEYVQGLKIGQNEQYVQAMYRMQVHDGSVRWICDGHYNATFDYLREDRDTTLWKCKHILGDDTSSHPVENLDGSDLEMTLASEDDGFSFSAETRTCQTRRLVSFDDRKKHLKLSGIQTQYQVKSLAKVLEDAYMIQRVSLSIAFSNCCKAPAESFSFSIDGVDASTSVNNGQVLATVSDRISLSKIGLWDVFVHPDRQEQKDESMTLSMPSSLPPPYSLDDDDNDHGQHRDETATVASSSSASSVSFTSHSRPLSSSSSSSSPFSKTKNTTTKSNKGPTTLSPQKFVLSPLGDLFILNQIHSLELPDLGKALFRNLNPSPGDFPHMQRLKIWGSEPVQVARD
ncbi:hypothetical protein BGZ94_002072, partial [Podila epigama]